MVLCLMLNVAEYVAEYATAAAPMQAAGIFSSGICNCILYRRAMFYLFDIFAAPDRQDSVCLAVYVA